MSENKILPDNASLTTAQLVKYSGFSLVFAALVLVTVILPAEYNIDPTGVGEKLGVMVFDPQLQSQVKASATLSEPATLPQLTAPFASELASNSFTPAVSQTISHPEQTIEVIVPSGKGVEYKFVMNQYQKLKYEWQSGDTPLYFDLHGEPAGDTTGYFESYAIATVTTMKGSFTAPFTGSHGWFWRNKSSESVRVVLTFSGEYVEHKLK